MCPPDSSGSKINDECLLLARVQFVSLGRPHFFSPSDNSSGAYDPKWSGDSSDESPELPRSAACRHRVRPRDLFSGAKDADGLAIVPLALAEAERYPG